MSAPVPAPPRPSAHAFTVAIRTAAQKPPCRCWMCTGPARMKLAALVERPALPVPARLEHAAFWERFSALEVTRGR